LGLGPDSLGLRVFLKIGRDDWIRTSDPLTPSQVRYQAAPHPDADEKSILAHAFQRARTASRCRICAPYAFARERFFLAGVAWRDAFAASRGFDRPATVRVADEAARFGAGSRGGSG
jgi:hypothetical protein